MNAPLDRLAAALADRYRIERELGAGGMATVYLAHDLRHDRPVALKVLRAELMAVLGADRFLAEIRTTANLQHPHILGLIDSGTVDGTTFYVMPYVAGESLRDRLKREKQLPIDDAVRIVREVALALDYAHRQGIVHRDIKPENVLLQDGQAMVADFGIALAATTASSGRMTETGMSLGTPPYMSPEQAMGERAITAKSDIYSLGCVLYEVLTGEPPFAGPTAQAIVAKVLASTPEPVTTLRRTVPPHVAAAIGVALEKVPADRFKTALEFAEALATPGNIQATPPAAAPGHPRRWLPWAGALGTAVAGFALGILGAPARDAAVRPVEFEIEPDSGHQLGLDRFAISLDGQTLVFSTARGRNPSQLYLRNLASRAVTPITGTEGGSTPILSPDAEWVAFNVGNQLKKVRLDGTQLTTLGSLPGFFVFDGSWGSDGQIVLALSDNRPNLYGLPASGGPIRRLIEADTGPRFASVRLLPNGRDLLVTELVGDVGASMGVFSVSTGRFKTLGVPGYPFAHLATGEIVYGTSDGLVLAQRFDPGVAGLTGKARQLASAVRVVDGFPQMAAAPNGTLAFEPAAPVTSLVHVDRTGKQSTLFQTVNLGQPRYSPDGRRIAFLMGTNAAMSVGIYSTVDSTVEPIGSGAHVLGGPDWTPDGRGLVVVANPGGTVGLFLLDASGTDSIRLLFPGFLVASNLTPDGKRFVFLDREGLMIADMAGGKPRPIVTTRAGSPTLSPDGQWLAYIAGPLTSNNPQTFVTPFPGPGSREVVSPAGGIEPVWSRSANELFYRDGDALVAAKFVTRPNFRIVERRVLFAAPFEKGLGFVPNYDVHPSGGHFLFVKRDAARRLVVRTGLTDPDR